MSSHWFINEKEIIAYLNWKKYENLNENCKRFLKFMYPEIKQTDSIYAWDIWWTHKADMYIKVNNVKYNISVKEWVWNSVHQEPVEEFIQFLDNSYWISNQIADNIRFFIWGDWTLDWTWNKAERLSAPQLVKKHRNVVDSIKDYFEPIKKDLVQRFLIQWWHLSNEDVDFVYHWNVNSWMRNSSSELIENVSTFWWRAAIPIWALTFQAWNRAIKANAKPSTEKKRWVIQLKFPKIKEYLYS